LFLNFEHDVFNSRIVGAQEGRNGMIKRKIQALKIILFFFMIFLVVVIYGEPVKPDSNEQKGDTRLQRQTE
jgi:hypothetical protein